MEPKNELLDAWIGDAVLVEVWTGPDVTDEEVGSMVDDPQRMLAKNGQVGSHVVELVGYDALGVVVRHRSEDAERYFVPWPAVLSIRSFNPDVERDE